jgi:hypothetical protein
MSDELDTTEQGAGITVREMIERGFDQGYVFAQVPKNPNPQNFTPRVVVSTNRHYEAGSRFDTPDMMEALEDDDLYVLILPASDDGHTTEELLDLIPENDNLPVKVADFLEKMYKGRCVHARTTPDPASEGLPIVVESDYPEYRPGSKFNHGAIAAAYRGCAVSIVPWTSIFNATIKRIGELVEFLSKPSPR